MYICLGGGGGGGGGAESERGFRIGQFRPL